MKKHLFALLTAFIPAVALAQDQHIPTPQWRPVYHFTPEKNWSSIQIPTG
jgi:fructan beta-fructosidase